MKRLILVPFAVAALVAAGCSSSCPSKAPKAATTEIEGAWKGAEVTPDHEGSASLTFSGQTLDFHGADANDWATGTFTVRPDTTPKEFIGLITNCGSQDVIGQKVFCIYKIENTSLTLTGNQPGDSNFPAAFNVPGARQFVLKRVE